MGRGKKIGVGMVYNPDREKEPRIRNEQCCAMAKGGE
jgi:hypothetical protein